MAKVRGMPHTLSSTLREYCESTTIHGFSYCITAGKTLIYLSMQDFIILTYRPYPSPNWLDISCTGLISWCLYTA